MCPWLSSVATQLIRAQCRARYTTIWPLRTIPLEKGYEILSGYLSRPSGNEANAADGPGRIGLPLRCDKGWFCDTFCSGHGKERTSNESIWDLVSSFIM